jgi:hypothetical protein
MKSPRLILAVTALCAMTTLTACSGDSDKDAETEPSAQASGSPTGAPEVSKPIDRKCTVEAEVTGVAQASWQGEGTSSNKAGPTIYEFSDGDDRMAVYAGTDDISTNANLTIGGATYTTTDPDAGFDVAADGRSATVDADTMGTDGAGPHVTATFTCGKQ